MNANPKTLEEHLDYLFSMVRLKLFFLARWQRSHPEEDFAYTLRNRIDIIRKTDINPEGLKPVGNYFELPQWQRIEKRLLEIYQLVRGDEKLFEEWGFDLLRPHVENRCERDFYDRSTLSAYQCGFLRHNLTANSNAQDTLGFHIANDCRPKSFFDDRNHIKECFTKLLDAAENRFQVQKISTDTWLNSVPKWLKLFPGEWQDHLSEPDKDIRWHYGFWGQFISARGTFNAKAGDYLRATGELRYYPRYSWCSIGAMREHLKNL